MRAMKDSGIEWIGEIPENWNIKRMKSCISQRDSGAWGEEPKGTDGDTICLRIADFNYSLFKFKDTDTSQLTYRHYDKDTIKRLSLEKNDILIEKSGGGEKTPVGRTVVFDKDYTALFANFMDRLKCSSFVKPSFMQYIFVTFYKNDYTRNYIKQTTGIQNLDLTSMLANEKVSVPPIEEQERIAEFLDRKCGEIDEVIAKTKKTVEEYKALKQSVITEAVTKGIRPNRPMKDSGIEWIGPIPDEWELSKVKYYVTKLESGVSVNAGQTEAIFPEYGVLKTSSVSKNFFDIRENKSVNKEEYNRVSCPVSANTIIISRMNTPELVGACGYVDKDYPNIFLPDRLWQVYFNNEVCVKYLYYWLRSSNIRYYYSSLAVGTSNSMQNISQDQFYNAYFPCPSLFEQQSISDYLDRKCAEIDKLIESKQQLLTELETYKKSVIYEYVTGKKEVIL